MFAFLEEKALKIYESYRFLENKKLSYNAMNKA